MYLLIYRIAYHTGWVYVSLQNDLYLKYVEMGLRDEGQYYCDPAVSESSKPEFLWLGETFWKIQPSKRKKRNADQPHIIMLPFPYRLWAHFIPDWLQRERQVCCRTELGVYRQSHPQTTNRQKSSRQWEKGILSVQVRLTPLAETFWENGFFPVNSWGCQKNPDFPKDFHFSEFAARMTGFCR